MQHGRVSMSNIVTSVLQGYALVCITMLTLSVTGNAGLTWCYVERDTQFHEYGLVYRVVRLSVISPS